MGRKARKGNAAAITAQCTVAGRLAAISLCGQLALMLAAAPPLALAQSTGDVHGVVVAQAEGPKPGATVVLTNASTGATREVSTGPGGRFTIAGVPAGTYNIAASLPAFATVRQEGVVITAGAAVRSRLELRPAAQSETIRLEPSATALDSLRTESATVVSAAEFEHLPLSTRNPLELVRLAPQLLMDARGPITAGGSPPAFATLLFDGVTHPLAEAGLEANEFSRHGIGDLRIMVTPPAVGASNGGPAIQVVSRAGSQSFTGTAFELFSDDALNSNTRSNAEAGRPRSGVRANQFGGAVGGPIARERHHFFASYDGTTERDMNEVFLGVPGDAALDGSAQDGLARLTSLALNWPQSRRDHILAVRTDHRLGTGQQVSLRYHRNALEGDGLAVRGPRQSSGTADQFEKRLSALSGYAGLTLHGLFNDLRVSYAGDRTTIAPTGLGPAAEVRERGATVLRFGSDPQGPRDAKVRSLELADTVMWTRGAHTLKAGLSARADRRDLEVAAHAGGAYLFQSLSAFNTDTPANPGDTFTQAFLANGAGSIAVSPDGSRLALFAQDRWLVRDTLTIDAGLRYDRDSPAQPPATLLDPLLGTTGVEGSRIPVDGNNWSPRIGAAWSPSPRYVVRASYDISHGITPVAASTAAHLYNGRDVRLVTLRGALGDPVPTYPASLPGPPPSALPTVVAFSNSFESARVQQLTTSAEWEWMPNTVLSIDYVRARGSQLPRAIERNVGPSTLASALVAGDNQLIAFERVAPGPLTSVGRLIVFESGGRLEYDGLTVEMRRRLSQGFQYRLGYTIAKASDNGLFAGSLVPETDDDRQVRVATSDTAATADSLAPSDYDRHQRLLASIVVFTSNFAEARGAILKTVLDDWRVGAIYTLQTGRPYSAYVADDLNGDGNRYNDLAPGTGRNQFRRGREGRVDARFAREFEMPGRVRATASLDVFNLLNASHYRTIDDVMFALEGTTLVRNPGFGERSDEREARWMQLGVAISF